MKIISIDPGGTTGWATFQLTFIGNDPKWSPILADHFIRYGHLGPGDHHNDLNDVLIEERPDLIIYERFEHRNNEFAQLTSVEYIGVIKQYQQQRDKCKIESQGASQALPWSDDKKMEHLDILITPPLTWRHANDARRHLLYTLATRSRSAKIRRHVLEQFKSME